jgi:hypothetical protein
VLDEYSRACVLVINREAAPAWEMYQDEMREVQTITDPLRKAASTGTRAENRIQICPVCGKPTRHAPDVLDELAAAVIETGGSARQIAADLMPGEYPTAARLRFPPPPPEGSQP